MNIDKSFAEARQRMNNRIEEQYISSLAFFQERHQYFELNELELTTTILKKKGFDKFGNLFTKGFLCVEIFTDKEKQITNIDIWVDVKNTKVQRITKNFITNIIISVNYYSSFQ